MPDTALTPADLRQWLTDHIDEIYAFMRADYEPTLASEDDLTTILGTYGFRDEHWNRPGYRFVHLGHDACGGEVAAWIRPGHEHSEPPVVFFGSEGGHGVLAATLTRWALLLAHAPEIHEYPVPSVVGPVTDSSQKDDPETLAAEAKALAAYRQAALGRFGQIPEMDVLTSDVDALNAEFTAWVSSYVRTDTQKTRNIVRFQLK